VRSGSAGYFRDARLVVEVDSDLFHAEALDAAADRRRDEAFRGAGFAVVRITEEDLRERPSLVGSRVMVALQQRAA
jgi:very-short-patch-repair endonuclease